jgi:DNA-binding GntR family transcriptional regulator
MYVRLANLFRDSIASGQWPAGHQVPTLNDLCAQYGVARVTVRNALKTLADDGLISITQGRGTFVSEPAASVAASTDLRHAINDPLQTAPSETIRVLGRQTVRSLPAELRSSNPAYEAYVRVRKVHAVRQQPFQVVEAYVGKPIHDRFPRGSEARSKTARLLRDYGQVHIRSTRQELTLAHAVPEMARLLDCHVGAVLVRIRRWRVDQHGLLVYAAVNLYRGDRFVLDIQTEHAQSSEFTPGLIPSTRPAID